MNATRSEGAAMPSLSVLVVRAGVSPPSKPPATIEITKTTNDRTARQANEATAMNNRRRTFDLIAPRPGARCGDGLSLARGMGPRLARTMGPCDGHRRPGDLMPWIAGPGPALRPR